MNDEPLIGAPMEVKYPDLGMAAAHFRCGTCSQQWDMGIPLKIQLEAYNRLLMAVRCPACLGKKVFMSEFRDVDAIKEDVPKTKLDTDRIQIKGLNCLHCEMTFMGTEDEDHERALELFRIHDSICPKHPQMIRIRELEAEIAALKAVPA